MVIELSGVQFRQRVFDLKSHILIFAKQWLFCLLFPCNVIGEFKKALKSDWLFCFTVPLSLAEKKM